MHEMSVALNILEIVEGYAREKKVSKVLEIEIEVGAMSGIMPESLTFALDVATENTFLAKAKKTINIIPVQFYCRNCNKNVEIIQIDSFCPDCKGYLEIINGLELRVKSMLVED